MRSGMIAALCSTLAMIGCGVPRDAAPRSLPTAEVPFDLLKQDDSPSPDVQGTRSMRLYLVRGSRVAVTTRRTVQAPSPAQVVEALILGPVGDEASRGLRTAIPPVTEVRAVSTEGGSITLDLTNEFTSVGSEQQILAIAQIVFSLTEIPDVTSVRLLVAGETVQLPREDGSLTSTPLRRDDYDATVQR